MSVFLMASHQHGIEIGPRMELKLLKIEEGMHTGTVLHHSHSWLIILISMFV